MGVRIVGGLASILIALTGCSSESSPIPNPVTIPPTAPDAAARGATEPSHVRVGDQLVLTPDGVVLRQCADTSALYVRADGDWRFVGYLTGGNWQAAGSPATFLACGSIPSDKPAQFQLPQSLAAGDHLICLANEAAGCAEFTLIG